MTRARAVHLLTWYALTRVVVAIGILAAAWYVQGPNGGLGAAPGYLDMVTIWDGQWYQRIAEGGYPAAMPVNPLTGAVRQNEWAFFPVFPCLTLPLVALGLPFGVVAMVLNLLLGAACVLLLDMLVRDGLQRSRRAGRRRPRLQIVQVGARAPGAADPAQPRDGDTGEEASRPGRRVIGPPASVIALGAVLAWLLWPATAVLQIAYSEPVAVALLLAIFVLLRRREYVAVTALVLVFGLARGVAAPLVVVVVVHLAQRWYADRRAGRTPLAGSRVSAALMVAASCVAVVLWPVIAAVRLGRADAYFAVQASWGQRPLNGPFVAWFSWTEAQYGGLGVTVLLAIMGLLLWAVLGPPGRMLTTELRVWGAAYPVYLLAATSASTSMVRFLLLDVPFLVVVGATAVRLWARGSAAGRLVVLAALAAAGYGIWWWTSTILVFAPPVDWPP